MDLDISGTDKLSKTFKWEAEAMRLNGNCNARSLLQRENEIFQFTAENEHLIMQISSKLQVHFVTKG